MHSVTVAIAELCQLGGVGGTCTELFVVVSQQFQG